MWFLKIEKCWYSYKKNHICDQTISFRAVFVQVPVAATETLSINHRGIYGPALQVVIYIKAWNTSHTVWIQILIMRFMWNDLFLLWMCHCPRSGMTPCWPPCDLYLTSARPQQVVEIKVRWSVLGLWSGSEKWVALVSAPGLLTITETFHCEFAPTKCLATPRPPVTIGLVYADRKALKI